MTGKAKLTGLLFLTALFVFGCSTDNSSSRESVASSKSLSRSIASGPFDLSPELEKNFWQEYQAAISSLTKDVDTWVGVVKLPYVGVLAGLDFKGKDIRASDGRIWTYKRAEEFSKMGIVMGWLRSNPIPTFKTLREKAPILTVGPIPIAEPVDGENVATVIVSKYKDVREVLDNPTTFTVRNYHAKIVNSVGDFMLADDAASTNFVEKPWMRKMLPESDLPLVRQLVRKLAREAIQKGTYIAHRPEGGTYGRLELVNQYARRVPIHLTQEYFGLTADDRTMMRWSRATQFDFFHNVKNDASIRNESLVAGHEMQRYVKTLIADRTANPRQDILSRLLEAKNSGAYPDLNDDHITSNLIGTLVGNVETTEAAVVQSLEVLFQPRFAKYLAEAKALAWEIENDQSGSASSEKKMALFSKYVWEALRFNPVNPFVVRYAEHDTYIAQDDPSRKTLIKKGSLVLAGTQSAMFDEDNFTNPEEFIPDRNSGDHLYFHLGYRRHRCLGDYISEIQVPEMVRAVLLLDGLKPASGYAGQVNKRGGLHPDEMAFPEKFVVEYNSSQSQPTNQVQLAEEDFAFEDYLMDFNRDDYRACLANAPHFKKTFLFPIEQAAAALTKTLLADQKQHQNYDYKRALLWCRLKKEFRTCVDRESRGNIPGTAATLEKCQQKTPLTAAELAFYKVIFFRQKVSFNEIPTNQATRVGGFAFEDDLKFYDRYTYRECFLNPAGLKAFPDTERALFYARLPIEFRLCNGGPVLLHDDINSHLGASVEEQYPKCVNGTYNIRTGRFEGALSDEEKYWYKKLMLNRK